ncbi:cytochrome P450 4c21-like [Homalodisca vitripennis]|uniref:cytochrome P450 4c21-like n=1 Tax=Homalodisca vitripennis TaxID=197043 RepID=UPI001EE9F82F|nr:cytochrome P450 4c21-like [Homalodisca vitripennis]
MDEIMNLVNEGWKDEERIRTASPEDDTERLPGVNLVDIIADNMPVVSPGHDWRDEVVTMIAAASDTVVGSLALVVTTLGHYPEIQDKIVEEILAVMGDLERDVTSADLNAMTYLGQVITESIRLHGTVVGIMRRATKDTKLTNITLPAGSRVVIMLHGMGWDKEQFPNPDQFQPDRFSPENQKKRHSYAFKPFSAGPRNCIGKAYAMIVMKTVLVHILRRLRVTSHTKLSDIVYELKVVNYSKTPLLVSFHPR